MSEISTRRRAAAAAAMAAVFLSAAISTSAQAQVSSSKSTPVFKAHAPDGSPYLVVICFQQDQCFEGAYQYCKGPYQPLEKEFNPMQGMRFVCRQSPKAELPSK